MKWYDSENKCKYKLIASNVLAKAISLRREAKYKNFEPNEMTNKVKWD